MHGDTALTLVKHAKRTTLLPHLPPYATELVRSVVREVQALDRDVNATLQRYTEATGNAVFDPASDPATACALLVDHLGMRRDKRCLLAYHRVRAERLEDMCWRGEDVLERAAAAAAAAASQQAGRPGDGQGEEETSALSPEEEEYVRQYADLLAALKGHWTDIDLTGSLEPPRELFVDVRVLKDAGEVQTEYG